MQIAVCYESGDMSLSNPGQDDMLPVTTQSHNNSRGQTTAAKDDTSVGVDDSRR